MCCSSGVRGHRGVDAKAVFVPMHACSTFVPLPLPGTRDQGPQNHISYSTCAVFRGLLNSTAACKVVAEVFCEECGHEEEDEEGEV